MSEFISKNLDQTLKHFKIRANAVAELSGAPASQISQFRRGQRGFSAAQLERVLVAMDELAPGSRLHFCLLNAGPINNKQVAVLLNYLADRVTVEPSHEVLETLS